MTKFILKVVGLFFLLTSAAHAVVWTKTGTCYLQEVNENKVYQYTPYSCSLLGTPVLKCATNKWGGTQILPLLPNGTCMVNVCAIYDATIVTINGEQKCSLQ